MTNIKNTLLERAQNVDSANKHQYYKINENS